MTATARCLKNDDDDEDSENSDPPQNVETIAKTITKL